MQPSMPVAPLVVRYGIPLLALGVTGIALGALRGVGRRRAIGAALIWLLWVSFWSGLARAGILARWSVLPPPLGVMLVACVIAGFRLGLSRVWRDATLTRPLGSLVLFQSFRLPLELLMHEAARHGTMPREMSFSGYNFDVVSGALALPVGLWLLRGGPRWAAVAFNVLGSLTLLLVLGIAMAASPALHAFGGGEHLNTWVAYFPFVLLPTVLVVAAIAGHVLLTGRLRAGS
jgi:hypothetical protein